MARQITLPIGSKRSIRFTLQPDEDSRFEAFRKDAEPATLHSHFAKNLVLAALREWETEHLETPSPSPKVPEVAQPPADPFRRRRTP